MGATNHTPNLVASTRRVGREYVERSTGTPTVGVAERR